MSKTAWIKSLLIPFLTAAGSIVLTLTGALADHHIFTMILGFALGGVFPIIAIVWFKIDLSKYFIDKLIFFALTVIIYVFHFSPLMIILFLFIVRPFGMFGYFIFPLALMIGEVIYALKKGENFMTKAYLILSSPVFVVLGLLTDWILSWS